MRVREIRQWNTQSDALGALCKIHRKSIERNLCRHNAESRLRTASVYGWNRLLFGLSARTFNEKETICEMWIMLAVFPFVM